MWIITVRSPVSDPREFVLPPGRFSIGRRPGNNLVLADESASAHHAELELEPQAETLIIHDLASASGIFVNHEEITHSQALHSGDQIRIGQHLIRVERRDAETLTGSAGAIGLPENQPLTRDLLLEALDRHAVLFVEASERLNGLTDLSQALEAIATITATALGVDYCQVIQVERFAQLPDWGLPAFLAQRAIHDRAVVAIADVSARPDLVLSPSAQRLGVRSVIYVPIPVGEEVAALIYVQRTAHTERQLTQDDVLIVVAVSHLASLTIQRTRLLQNSESFKTLTTADGLTQLSNRRHFLEVAEHEVQRARRFQRPLSVILLDVDRLSQVNQAHGRAVGDELLRAVAARCRLALRQVDLAGRYDGDEFAILTIETDLRSAELIAERLRRQVASSPIYTEGGLVPVTISLGLATLSEHGPKLTQLFAAAATALLAAKNSGGDRVEIAGASLPE